MRCSIRTNYNLKTLERRQICSRFIFLEKWNVLTSVKARLSRKTTSFTNGRTNSFLWKRLLYCSWCSVNFNSCNTSQPNDSALARSFTLTWTILVNQVSNWHPALRKNLHSPHITPLRLRLWIITIFSFDRIRESKSFSFPIFFMIPKESGQNKTTRAILNFRKLSRSLQKKLK